MMSERVPTGHSNIRYRLTYPFFRIETPAVSISRFFPIASRNTVLLWAGWVLPQFLLFGPALLGFKVLVPCDLLGLPGFYLPSEEIEANPVTSNNALTDLVLIYPMIREFTAAEFHAGRIPHWQPQNFCGRFKHTQIVCVAKGRRKRAPPYPLALG